MFRMLANADRKEQVTWSQWWRRWRWQMPNDIINYSYFGGMACAHRLTWLKLRIAPRCERSRNAPNIRNPGLFCSSFAKNPFFLLFGARTMSAKARASSAFCVHFPRCFNHTSFMGKALHNSDVVPNEMIQPLCRAFLDSFLILMRILQQYIF